MMDDPDDKAPRLADALSIALVVVGGGLMLAGDGPLRQFGAAFLALAIARIALARWLFAPDPSTQSISSTPSTANATTFQVNGGEAPVRSIDNIAATLGVAAVSALFATVVLYGSNIPFWDEFVSTLKFATNFSDMTLAERAKALIAGHYGHRIVTMRLAALAVWTLFGELNFFVLMLIAFACLIGAAATMYTGQRRDVRTLALFAPFLLFLFQPQYHQLTLWGFSVQHFAALLFETLTLLALAQCNKRHFIWAIIGFTLATFSFGNGILLGPLGLAYLCVQRREREALVWLGVTTVLAALYFHGLGIGPTQGARPSLLAQLWYLLEFLGSGVTLGFFTDFLGAMDAQTANYPALVWLARATGALVVVGFVWLTLRRFWRQNFVVYGLLALTVGSGALAALHRTGADYSSPFMSRYTMHSALCLGLLYLAFVESAPQRARKLLPISLAVSAAFCIGSFAVTVPYIKLHRGDMRFSAWMASNAIYTGEPLKIATPFFDLKLLQKSEERKVYSVPIADIMLAYSRVSAGKPVEPTATPRIVYSGKNAVMQTWLLNVPEYSGRTIMVNPPVDNVGVALTTAEPIELLSVHPRLLQNSGYGDATHFVIEPWPSGGTPLPQ